MKKIPEEIEPIVEVLKDYTYSTRQIIHKVVKRIHERMEDFESLSYRYDELIPVENLLNIGLRRNEIEETIEILQLLYKKVYSPLNGKLSLLNPPKYLKPEIVEQNNRDKQKYFLKNPYGIPLKEIIRARAYLPIRNSAYITHPRGKKIKIILDRKRGVYRDGTTFSSKESFPTKGNQHTIVFTLLGSKSLTRIQILDEIGNRNYDFYGAIHKINKGIIEKLKLPKDTNHNLIKRTGERYYLDTETFSLKIKE